ncbi:MAG: hypothetical protein JW951_00110, partial [Lentisphaerae bacterium]|nr:hypothetical protein [Lentisphaerota bacterium]
ARRLKAALFNALLFAAAKGLGDLEDMNRAVCDILGMSRSPLEMMREMGRDGVRKELRRLSAEAGPRFQPALADVLEA